MSKYLALRIVCHVSDNTSTKKCTIPIHIGLTFISRHMRRIICAYGTSLQYRLAMMPMQNCTWQSSPQLCCQCAYSRVGIPMVVQVFLIQARRICTLKAIACSVPKILLTSCIEHLLYGNGKRLSKSLLMLKRKTYQGQILLLASGLSFEWDLLQHDAPEQRETETTY